MFVDNPVNTTAVTNQPYTLTCLAHDGEPLTYNILWKKDGIEQSPSDSFGRIQIIFNNLESQYLISSVLYADEGDYVCEALDQANAVLFTSYPGTLSVQGMSKGWKFRVIACYSFNLFHSLAVPLSVCASLCLSLFLCLSLSPVSVYLCLLSLSPLSACLCFSFSLCLLFLSLSVSISLSFSLSSALFFVMCDCFLSCVIVSSPFIHHYLPLSFCFLSFLGVPAFEPLLESQTVVAGSTVTFQCSPIGDPPPSITWSHNNQLLSEGGKISFTESQLTITNVQEENDGFYECIASNAFGSNITSAKLSVNSKWVWRTFVV